ncbi:MULTISPECIES: efflux RND transporter periplasmic adaptor subunit [unclassified Robiginitalea]|uniref:efflux RND transporter periplasmic adaptor subunit n=1 Tax=Robiginitalea TaxID=252306 RepID=UPI00234B8F00|nr:MULTISPECIES: HlyD family efflux transporter periplasmic adaptor subunit [unclassified Robiginitalea]MDC6355608.1 HlyD family efflux transporter periplasmic adaptor subunit [Robiginitalea sp. PM2]MDC6376019.1 HlyD family efflux transporter periplasmic adaptor subunit [Robiginitalea sp. SP8]
MDKRKIILSVLGILLIALSIYAAQAIISSRTTPTPRPSKVVKTVFVDTVRNTSVPIIVPANGTLVARNRVELYSEVQGVFQRSSKLFKPGQKYSRGERIITIDAAEYRAGVQSAKSNLYNLITSVMPDLRLDYPEVSPKWQAYLTSFDLNETTPPLPDMPDEKERYFISGRGILTSYYNVKNMEERLAKYTIRAPFNGVLTEALVTEGTLIRSGQKLGEFIDTGVYELEVAISKTFSDLLEIGEEVELSNLEGSRTYSGTVSRINARVDQNSQTITAFIEVREPSLKEGMYLEANLNAKKEQDAIEIDRGLLLDNDQIFIVRDSILDLIDVNPVYFTDKSVVLKDVPEGATIVSRPVVGAYAGMLVKVYEGNTQTN